MADITKLIREARELPGKFQAAQLSETAYLEDDALAQLDAVGYLAVYTAKRLADAFEAAENARTSTDAPTQTASVLEVESDAPSRVTPTDEREAFADRLARRLIGDPKQLMLAEGTGALHVALSETVRSVIEDVYADCGDSDPGVLSSNIAQRLAWDLPPAILADTDFRRTEVTSAEDVVLKALGIEALRRSAVPVDLTTEQRHALVEGAVDVIEPCVTNHTAAYNTWNNIASDERFVRAIVAFDTARRGELQGEPSPEVPEPSALPMSLADDPLRARFQKKRPQGEPCDAPRSVPRPGVLRIKGESGTLCGVQNPSHVTGGPRYADCTECLAALHAAGGVR